uniref:C2H2-type domain-containing protein n=1 Tax=Rhodosorus marinus TaxID=101924 RepID=A0A7S2ZBA8_9RHOD|mmetsp:Transcript_12718/g.51245  ORF Transcript_12718/g.51245 Transcript_12718/m.51245 type:complete len:176 (+) Transcript_12718:367-894(+)
MSYFSGSFDEFMRRRGQMGFVSSEDTMSVEDDSFFSPPSSKSLFGGAESVSGVDERNVPSCDESVVSSTSMGNSVKSSCEDDSNASSWSMPSFERFASDERSCEQCQKTFKTERTYARHMRTHQNIFAEKNLHDIATSQADRRKRRRRTQAVRQKKDTFDVLNIVYRFSTFPSGN